MDQIENEFSVGGLEQSHVELHQPLQGMEKMENLGNTSSCNAEESMQVVYEDDGITLVGKSFTELPLSTKVAIEQNDEGEVKFKAENEMSMQEKQQDVTGGEEQLNEQVDRGSCIEDAMESTFLPKIKEAELEVSRDESRHHETSGKECSAITSEESTAEIKLEKFDLEYAEKNLGKIEGAKDGASLAHNIDANQNLTELDEEMKDAKLAEDGKEFKIEPARFSISTVTDFQAPSELQNPDTVVRDNSVNESSDSICQEEADDSVLKRTAVLDTIAKGAEASSEESRLAAEKTEDCIPVATKELLDSEAVATTKEETPTTAQVDSFQQEEAREDRDEVSSCFQD